MSSKIFAKLARQAIFSSNLANQTVLKRFIFKKYDPFTDIVRSMDNAIREMDRGLDQFYKKGFEFRPTFFNSRSHILPIEKNEDGTRTYRLKFDLSDFKPENINLTIKDKTLTVSAKQEREEIGKNKFKFYKDYTFEYRLPDDIDIEKIVSKQESDGTLIIEAPLPKLELESEKPKQIPIKKL